MIKNKTALKNIFKVACGQGVSLISGIAVGLLIPKILSVDGYGFFRIYTLYVTYTALLHFGFVDGILLKLAGNDYEALNKEKVRAFTRFFVTFQSAIGITMSLCSLFVSNPDYSFILLMLGINMIIINLLTYYQFISQATQRFTEFTARNFMVSILKILFVLILLLLKAVNFYKASYQLYIIGLNVIDGVLLCWYVLTYRDITFGKKALLSETKKEIIDIFKVGIILTAAYQVSHLVFSLDRQFVSVLYPTDTYAVYSFAYNIVTLISTMISSLAIVLLPMLKKAKKEYVKNNYTNVLTVIALIVGIAVVCYYPFAIFIKWFLPNYEYSLEYLKIVLPSLMYSSCISVVMFTFCKTLDKNLSFFVNGCIALAIGFTSNAVAYWIFKTPESISYASFVTMALWFIIEGVYLKKTVNVTSFKVFIYLFILSISFLAVSTFIKMWWLSMIAYVALYLLVTFVLYFKFIKAFVKDRLKHN